MRGNGLSAAAYVAVAELEPQVADVLLGLLREEQIAAYAEPCRPIPSLTLEVQPAPTPRDRLYVDESAVEDARALVDAELPRLKEELDDQTAADPRPTPDPGDPTDAGDPAEAGDPTDAGDPAEAGERPGSGDAPGGTSTVDEERAWAEIVASYEAEAEDPIPRWPTSEDVEPTDDFRQEGLGGSRTATAEHPQSRGSSGTAGPRDDTGTDAGEQFVPPTPPPLPSIDPVTKAAWAALMAGPVLFLLVAVADVAVPSWLLALGAAAFIGGFIALILRLKGGPPDDEDGAIL